MGEAKAAFELLKGEGDDVLSLVTRDLGLDVADSLMPVTQYTRFAASLSRSNLKWKLSNRVVDKGKVLVDETQMKTLLREAIRERVLESVDVRKVPDDVKKAAKALKNELAGQRATVGVDSLEDDAMPPCMAHIISSMEVGNASHNSMFILGTFLANLGLNREDVLAVFSRSPGYDEGKTSYQLEFITGERGGTEYTCPTCATIKSHGLCRADCKLKHPLQYYRRHMRRRPRKRLK